MAEPRLEQVLAEKAHVDERIVEPFRRLDPAEARPFENCVPLYDLAVAAGAFSDGQSVDEVGLGDPESGGHFTVKLYESTKVEDADDTWRHTSIVLRPDSTTPGYEPIVLTSGQADGLRIVAELVAVLG